MALAAQQQVRQMYVGLDYPGHANVTALQGGTVGDLACLSKDGTAVAAGDPFVVMQLKNDGTVTSDVIDPSRVKYSKSVSYTASTLGTATISGLTANINTLYTVEIIIRNFGSYSPENEYVKKGFYQAVTGDDQEAIVDGLIASLNRNFSRENGATSSGNPWFTFSRTGSGASSALVVTEKTDWLSTAYDKDKRTRSHIDFVVNASFTTLPTIANTAHKQGYGVGYQVAADEHYLAGERNDYMRSMGYPHDMNNTELFADASGSYNLIEIGYWEEGRDEAKKSNKQLTIAMPFTNLAGNSVINGLITDLNTALGAGSIDALATS